ncbi:MAG: 4-hydroxythreonine-4-phosphate dehydrogenase PdxA [Bacteroidaceae bacterium]|nr:4-hydroxythreonine-4-phosphate dehydrogenase PdxA [Bacteroidaceae bacterium]
MKEPKIGITQGHAGGVGYEVILKAFSETPLLELCQPIVYGNWQLASEHRQALALETNFLRLGDDEQPKDNVLNIRNTAQVEIPMLLGSNSPEGVQAEETCRQRALDDCKQGLIDAVVHAPSNTELQTDSEQMRVLVGEQMRVADATGTNKEEEVVAMLTTEWMEQRIKQFNHTLKRDFLITRPRIAVLSLHDDDQKEETDILMPAIEKVIGDRINAFGPFPAEKFFADGDYLFYDGVIALTSAQAEAPFRQQKDSYAVSYLAEQEIVQTAPWQNAGLKIAGKGEASTLSFTNAIYLATDIIRHRADYDLAHHDPLQKLYADKRER